MIRTITVYTGESEYAKAAQQHAIRMAKRLNARLKVVGLWDSDGKVAPAGGQGSMSDFAKSHQERIIKTAEEYGVRAEGELRGDGMSRGLLEEARATDILVLGLPTKEEEDDDIAAALIKSEMPILHEAECALLVVNRPPSDINNILVKYGPGRSGKSILQMTGAIAQNYHAKVGLLTVENDIAIASELASSAAEYLKGYDIPSVKILPRSGPSDWKVAILEEAQSFKADLITIGEPEHNWLERFFGENVAERTALSTSIPLLISR